MVELEPSTNNERNPLSCCEHHLAFTGDDLSPGILVIDLLSRSGPEDTSLKAKMSDIIEPIRPLLRGAVDLDIG